MFRDFLDSKNKLFKLVCGAGNECPQEVERLTALYSLAGCEIFDICAKKDILLAAKKGIEISGVTNNRYICVSTGMKGDPHISKAKIDKNKCKHCYSCEAVCINKAITNCVIDEKKCIGCGKCIQFCHYNAISSYDTDIDLNVVLPELVKEGIDCIEFHVTSEFDNDIDEKWSIINNNFDGVLSICIDRLNLGNKQVLERIKRMIKSRKPYSTIIQADGIPMSGCDDKYKTTLQAVAMAEIIQDAKLPVYILISGGTNSKTAHLAQMCGIDYKGIAIGSYARKIVKPYIERKDFYSNKEIFNKALNIAKELVEKSLN